jgi:hypothetical protein
MHEALLRCVPEDGDLDPAELCADAAIAIEALIDQNKVRDWTTNLDVQKRMKQAVEDYFYSLKDRHDLTLAGDDLDLILDHLVDVAKHRDAL